MPRDQYVELEVKQPCQRMAEAIVKNWTNLTSTPCTLAILRPACKRPASVSLRQSRTREEDRLRSEPKTHQRAGKGPESGCREESPRPKFQRPFCWRISPKVELGLASFPGDWERNRAAKTIERCHSKLCPIMHFLLDLAAAHFRPSLSTAPETDNLRIPARGAIGDGVGSTGTRGGRCPNRVMISDGIGPVPVDNRHFTNCSQTGEATVSGV